MDKPQTEIKQREIKFRAYSKKLGAMIHVGKISFSAKKVYAYTDDEDWSYLEDVKIEELMQFTGLKDKFGKGIYEGDILEITNQTSELKGSKVSVVFKEGCFCDGYYGWRLSQHKEYNLEIIGNIYENPALLNG